ncbi:hypothetical protein LINPERHAP1_LOCUS10189, partial [Linum perenne]
GNIVSAYAVFFEFVSTTRGTPLYHQIVITFPITFIKKYVGGKMVAGGIIRGEVTPWKQRRRRRKAFSDQIWFFI